MEHRQRILITGERGDVGSVIFKLYGDNGFEIYSFNDKNIDKKADRILHLAAKSPPANADDIVKSNIEYLQKIVEHAEKNGINEFIFFSAISIYGTHNKEDLSENDPINLPDIYGCSKLFGEEYLKNSSLNVLSLRFPAILGVRNTTNLLSRFYMKLKNNESVEITNYNRLFNNFISVENIFDFLTTVKISKQFDVVNLAFNKELTLLEIVKLMKKLLNSKSKIILSEKKSNFLNLSIEKAMSEYDFKPHNTKESIKKWIYQRKEYENDTISQP